MAIEYQVTGNLKNGRVVELDHPLPVGNIKVRVRIEPIPPLPIRNWSEVIAEIRAEQATRGFVPPTKDEVDRSLETERNSWER